MTARMQMSGGSQPSWWEELLRRVREKETRRQIRHNDIRKTASRFFHDARVRADIPALLPEFLKVLLGSALGFWIITALLSHFFHAKPVYVLAVFGLLFSVQTTYYKHRLSVDPAYKIPKCGCVGAGKDSSEVVLKSRESAILKVPNSTLGALLYAVLLWLVFQGHVVAAMLAAVLATLVSAYLGYVMVFRVAALCSNCINIAALNLLILWQLFR